MKQRRYLVLRTHAAGNKVYMKTKTRDLDALEAADLVVRGVIAVQDGMFHDLIALRRAVDMVRQLQAETGGE